MTSKQYEILKTLAKFPGHKTTRLRLVEERILGMLDVSYDVQILIRMGMIQPCFIFDFFAYQLTHKGASFIEQQKNVSNTHSCNETE